MAQRKKTIEGYIKELMKLPCNDRTGLLDGLGYNGRRVTAIAQSALSGGAVEKLIITEDTNLRMLENGAFKDASELRELRIYFRQAEELMPPADFFGTRDDFRIYVPRDTDYNVDYNWVEVLGIGELLKFMED